MAKIERFEDLEVWKKASEIAIEVYTLTSSGKLSKDYGLKDQIQRAAISISNNIAEGFEYDNRNDFVKFLRYAKGSTGEVRSMLNMLLKIGLVDKECHKRLYNELEILSKQLYTFIKYLKGTIKV